MSPSHFFYRMTFAECTAYLRGLDLRTRADWERTRWNVYASLKPWCKDLSEPSDVMRFAWDSADGSASLDETSLPGLRGRAKEFEKIMLTNRSVEQ